MKKIFFFGTPQIAVPSLIKINNDPNYRIIGVGVFPDSKIGRKQILKPSPVKIEAQRLGLPIFEIQNKKKLIEIIKENPFDLGIVIAFGMIFPTEILNNPQKKIINIHFSSLPKYRGASPVQTAILKGDKKLGITFQFLAPKLDSGDILLQPEFDISEKNTQEVWEDFGKKTALLLPDFLNNFFDQKNSSIKPKKQDETKATFCRKLKKFDGEINFQTMTTHEIYQKFLAFTPWPGIYTQTQKGPLKLLEISSQAKENFIPIKTKNSEIYIKKAQLAGKKATDFKNILQGHSDLFSPKAKKITPISLVTS